jgi:hypothetical protein
MTNFQQKASLVPWCNGAMFALKKFSIHQYAIRKPYASENFSRKMLMKR